MSEETNEILAAAKDAKARQERVKAKDDKGANWSTLGAIGLGVGIGSAALAAALLYGGRGRDKRDDD